MTEFSERRQRYFSQPCCEMVTPDEFMRILTSHSDYVREDEPSANLLGLRNTTTGDRVYVAAEDLERMRFSFLQLN